MKEKTKHFPIKLEACAAMYYLKLFLKKEKRQLIHKVTIK